MTALLPHSRCAIIDPVGPRNPGVPLSEDEQKILSEIEEKLTASDPTLAREVGSTTVYSHAFRNIKWALVLFLVGVVVLVAALSTHYVVSFLGFLIMLAAALLIERNARRLGRAGWDQMTNSRRSAGLKDYLGSTGQKMRERFKREE